MAATHTRVHTRITLANPHLACSHCRQAVTAWHNEHACGCHGGRWSHPCGHAADMASTCPTWGPVDGCTCAAVLGHTPHEPAGEAP